MTRTMLRPCSLPLDLAANRELKPSLAPDRTVSTIDHLGSPGYPSLSPSSGCRSVPRRLSISSSSSRRAWPALFQAMGEAQTVLQPDGESPELVSAHK